MDSQITFRLPADLDRKIRERAKRLLLKRSDIVRLALVAFLEKPNREHRQELIQQIRQGTSPVE